MIALSIWALFHCAHFAWSAASLNLNSIKYRPVEHHTHCRVYAYLQLASHTEWSLEREPSVYWASHSTVAEAESYLPTHRWTGPRAVAILAWTRPQLHRAFCLASSLNPVLLALVTPLAHWLIFYSVVFGSFSNGNCESSAQFGAIVSGPTPPYPANTMRNIALELINTHIFGFDTAHNHVLLVDMDIIPPLNLHQSLRRFIRQTLTTTEHQKVALILPTLELNLTKLEAFPRDKVELLHLVRAGVARPFYSSVCFGCHTGGLDFKTWYRAPPHPNLSPLCQINWADPFEPFFVANLAALPPFDERFVGYGKNRLSQIWEMDLIGWEWVVLDSAFLMHHGLKQPSDLSPRKQRQLKLNRKLFQQFQRDRTTFYAIS